MVNFPTPRSPRSVAQATPMLSPEALDPASTSRDINAIVENAAKRFDDMDNDLKSLMQDMKNYQAAMAQVNENRLKTARHLETFATTSPFANFVSPPIPAVVGTEALPNSGSSVASAASGKATDEGGEEEKNIDEPDDEPKMEEKKPEGSTTDVEDRKPEASTETEKSKPTVTFETEGPKTSVAKETQDAKPKADVESFAGVHQSAFSLSKKYNVQYGEYIVSYVENWERVVSQRIQGLLIHYRELQDGVVHYNKKVGGLVQKVDRSKSVRHKLAERLDRNEIKEMGAVEARDTVGEHLYLYIEEVMERAWRDVFPLLLRVCRFEAEYSAAQAKLLSNLVMVAETLQVVGEDEECNVMGRLDDLQKKHPEELYTEENPFVKLTPRKKRVKQPELSDSSEEAAAAANEELDVDSTSEAQTEKVEV